MAKRGRPVGSKARKAIVPNALGAVGSFCDMDELIEKIGEVIHEQAKITAVMLTPTNEVCYRIEGEAGWEFETKTPVLYNSTVDLLQAVIDRVKGK